MEPTQTPRHSVSVAGVILDDDGSHVLLVKRRDNGRWEPPGGVLELDETIEEGLRREIREETGAEVQVGPLTGVYKNMNRGIVALVFRCSATSTPAPETSEAQEVEWKHLSTLSELMPDAYSVRIADAAAMQTSPPVRAHDGVDLWGGRY